MKISLRPAASSRARFASSRASTAWSCRTCARGAPRSIAATRCSTDRDSAGTPASFATASRASASVEPVPLASTARRSSPGSTPDPTSPTRRSASRRLSPADRQSERNSRTVGSSSSIRPVRRRARTVTRRSQTATAATAHRGDRRTDSGPPRPTVTDSTASRPPRKRPPTAQATWIVRKATTSVPRPACRNRIATCGAPPPSADRTGTVESTERRSPRSPPPPLRTARNGVRPTGSAMSRRYGATRRCRLGADQRGTRPARRITPAARAAPSRTAHADAVAALMRTTAAVREGDPAGSSGGRRRPTRRPPPG